MSELPEPSEHSSEPRGAGLPYPSPPPLSRDDLPDRGLPGAPASWGLRALARILDYLLFSLVFGFIAAALGTGTNKNGEITGPAWPLLLFPIFFLAYETIALFLYGQTIGKWLCQIKVVNYNSGNLAEVSSTAVRAFVPGIFLLLAAVGSVIDLVWLGYAQFIAILIYLASIADVMYRGPHDKAAGTIVLAAPRARRAG